MRLKPVERLTGLTYSHRTHKLIPIEQDTIKYITRLSVINICVYNKDTKQSIRDSISESISNDVISPFDPLISTFIDKKKRVISDKRIEVELSMIIQEILCDPRFFLNVRCRAAINLARSGRINDAAKVLHCLSISTTTPIS